MQGSGMVKADLKAMELAGSGYGVQPERLTLLLAMDVDQEDFIFQQGNLGSSINLLEWMESSRTFFINRASRAVKIISQDLINAVIWRKE